MYIVIGFHALPHINQTILLTYDAAGLHYEKPKTHKKLQNPRLGRLDFQGYARPSDKIYCFRACLKLSTIWCLKVVALLWFSSNIARQAVLSRR